MTAQPQRERAALGGGCCWCLEVVYKYLKGVEGVVSVDEELTHQLPPPDSAVQ